MRRDGFRNDLRGVEAARLALAGGAAPEVIEAAAFAGGGWLEWVARRYAGGVRVGRARFRGVAGGFCLRAEFLRLACECAERAWGSGLARQTCRAVSCPARWPDDTTDGRSSAQRSTSAVRSIAIRSAHIDEAEALARAARSRRLQ